MLSAFMYGYGEVWFKKAVADLHCITHYALEAAPARTSLTLAT